MYIRYEMNPASLSNDQTTIDTILQDIYNALSGTYTSPSQFNATTCNSALSRIVGPTGGLSGITLNGLQIYPYVTWSSGYLQINKRHSDHNTVTGLPNFTPTYYSFLNWDTSGYGLRPRMATTNGYTYAWPYNSASGYWQDNTGNYGQLMPSNISRIYVYASAYWIIFQAVNTSGNIFTHGYGL